MLITSHIRDLATRYWESMHSPRDRQLEREMMAGRYRVVDPSCVNTATVRYLRNRLCAVSVLTGVLLIIGWTTFRSTGTSVTLCALFKTIWKKRRMER